MKTMLSLEEIELIEMESEGTLTPAQATALGRLRNENPAFEQEQKIYTLLMQGIDAAERERLEARVKDWEDAIRFESSVPRRENKRLFLPAQEGATANRFAKTRTLGWVAAAAIAVLAVSIGVFKSGDFAEKGNYANQVREHFTPFEPEEMAFTSQKSSNDKKNKADAHFENAMNLYATGNYAEALDAFDAFAELVPANDGRQTAAAFYTGVCQVEEGVFDLAVLNLSKVIKAGNFTYKTHAQWYLALAQLGDGDAKAATETLETILQNPEHPNYEAAQKLYDAL